jgi:hypothetical protein
VTAAKVRLTYQGGDTDLDVPAGSWVGLPQGTILAGLTAIAIATSASKPTSSASMTLQCQLRGVPFSLPAIPLALRQATGFQKVVQLDTDVQARRDELKHHLMQNRLYYSQAAYRSLDSAAITSILAPFQYQGAPLVDQVDPTPITVAANYLVLRAPTAASAPATVSAPTAAIAPRSLRASAAGTPVAASTDPAAHGPSDSGVETELTAWGKLLALRGIHLGTGDSRLVSLPSGGVFAEAVLGRSNSAEVLDITRFWNWQDSPIPIQPPEVAPVSTGSRAAPEDLKPGQLGAPVLNISSPSALPDPSGLAAILGAIANGNMFRDMSGLAGTQGLVTAGMQGTLQAADQAGQLASANMRTEAQKAIAMGQIAADLVKAFLGAPSTGGSVQGISAQGAKITQGKNMDSRGVSPRGTGSGGAGAGLNGQGTGASGLGGGARSGGVRGGTSTGGFEAQAYESVLAPGQSPSVSDLAAAVADSLSPGMGEIQLASASQFGAPLPHPSLATAAEALGDDTLAMESYRHFQDDDGFGDSLAPTWGWFFSPNNFLLGSITRPAKFDSWGDWDAMKYQAQRVLVNLADIPQGDIGIANFKTPGRLETLQTSYALWPESRVAVFQHGDSEPTNTCNIFLGDALFLAGFGYVMHFSGLRLKDGKYFSAKEVWEASAPKRGGVFPPFVPVNKQDIARGDIVAFHGNHVEIVTHVSPVPEVTFCSRGGYRQPMGQEKCGEPDRVIDDPAIRFRRVSVPQTSFG